MNRSYLLILPLLLAALPLSIGVCQVNSNENNALVFTVNDTEYMRISGTAGYVGVKSTGPRVLLDVSGSAYIGAPSTYWGGSGQSFYSTGYGQLDHSNAFTTTLTSNGFRNASGFWTSYAANANAGAAQVQLWPAGYITFMADAVKANGSSYALSERMRMTSDGNLGISTTSPIAKLDVVGNVSVTGMIDVGHTAQACSTAISGSIRYETTSDTIQVCTGSGWKSMTSTTIVPGAAAGSTGDIQFNNAGALAADTGQLYWDAANNRMGVGTLTPTAGIDVSGAAIASRGSLSGFALGDRAVGNTSSTVVYRSGNILRFWDSVGGDQVVLNHINGNVGIGTTTPATPLEVSGSGDTIRLSKLGAATNPYVSWYNDAVRQAYMGYGTKNTDFDITTQNGTRLDITGDTGITLNATTGEIAANDRLLVAANARMTGATSNSIAWSTIGVAAPGAGSAGMKLQLYGGTANIMAATDFALGIESGNLWLNTGGGIKLYSGSTLRAEMASTGTVSATAFHASNGDTAAAPGHTWIGDTNTGMFHPVADIVGISINGTERARVFSSGVSTTGAYYVGNGSVGTPAFNFASDLNTGFYRVYGDAIGTSINGTDRFRITSAGVSVTGYVSVSGIVDIGTQALGNSGDTAAAPSFSWTGDTNVGMFRPTTDEIGLTTAGAERVRVDASGNVGIGTTNPGYGLDVYGKHIRVDNSAGSYARISLKTTNNEYLLQTEDSSFDGIGFYKSAPATAGWQLVMATNGNVGIGTTVPLDKLHLDGDNSYVRIDGANGYMGVKLTDDGVLKWQLYNSSGTSDRFYIVDKDSNNGVYIAQDATAWTANSDRRLKKNIKEYSVLDRIDGFRAVTFDWKSDGKRDFGVIAQEVHKSFPEVVDKGTDDLDRDIKDTQDPAVWGVRYDRIGVLALEGVKELNARLRAENAELRKAIEELRADVKMLKPAR